jgi:hypothetical protein
MGAFAKVGQCRGIDIVARASQVPGHALVAPAAKPGPWTNTNAAIDFPPWLALCPLTPTELSLRSRRRQRTDGNTPRNAPSIRLT